MRYPQLKRDLLKFWKNGMENRAKGLQNTSADTDFFYIAVFPGFKSKTGWIWAQEEPPRRRCDGTPVNDHLRFDDDGVIVYMDAFPREDNRDIFPVQEAALHSHDIACYFIQEMELCD